MDIYVRFFLSLLNARSPCRDCNSAIIPRLRTTYRTNLFANSYFCRTSGPHSGPILQQIAGISGSEDLREDQISSKSSAKLPAGTTHRTNTPFAQGLTHTLRGYIIALPDTPRGYTDVHNVAPHPQHDHRPVLFTDAGYCSHKNVFS